MIVGFTGTRFGMNEQQKENFAKILSLIECSALIHGDCIGADTDAHHFASELNINVHIFPCIHPLRAFNQSKNIREAKSPFTRNRDIVNSCDIMIACPKNNFEEKGGTWYTINYAKKAKKPVAILYPSGKIEKIN